MSFELDTKMIIIFFNYIYAYLIITWSLSSGKKINMLHGIMILQL
jgi:hypothetical protein